MIIGDFRMPCAAPRLRMEANGNDLNAEKVKGWWERTSNMKTRYAGQYLGVNLNCCRNSSKMVGERIRTSVMCKTLTRRRLSPGRCSA